MSIFRETFKPGVQNQLRTRQKAIANRTPESIQYLNSRNAWVRMSSSVNVNNSNTLASQYILQGGTLTNALGKTAPKSGIGDKATNAYSTVSPGGTLHRLGIRPMPGITGVDVQSKGSYGSLRSATVNFVAWDISQLEELELLYMRPGFTVLLEWGWAPYLNENGTLSSEVKFYDIISKTPDQNQIYIDLFGKASKNGNYEAMYGKIQNYSWKARPDGGYDCTTTIISIGEVIDSLKVNYAPFYIANVEKTGLIASTLSGMDGERLGTIQNQISGAYSQNIIAGIAAELYSLTNTKLNDSIGAYQVKSELGTLNLYKAAIKQFNNNSGNSLNGGNSIYITLESLAKILNTYVLLSASDSSGKKAPYVRVSVNSSTITSDGSPLLCLGNEYQISTNPAVCLIANQAWSDPATNLGIGGVAETNAIKSFVDSVTIASVDKGYFYKGDYTTSQYGVIGNIYINLNYIYSLVTSDNVAAADKKEKNDISLYTFLKKMMMDVNASIGNVANFDIHVDPIDGNVARIIDINYVDTVTRQNAYSSSFMFEMQKVGPDAGSIMQNYSFESSIFPEQSAIVAIGAQVKGGALGSDTNTLVDFYKNLTDRIMPRKDAPGADLTKVDEKLDFEAYRTNLQSIVNFINQVSANNPNAAAEGQDNTYDVLESSKYSNALRDIINFFKSVTNNNNKNRAIIPTKLTFDMDGIGGIVIGNMFRIPKEILPKGYRGDKAGPAQIGFLVTRLGHSIQNSSWTTKVESQFVILDSPRGREITAEDRKVLTQLIDQGNFTGAEEKVIEVTGREGNAEAMKIAGDAIFGRNGQEVGLCAGYTFNIARAYNEVLKGQSPKTALIPSGGNANQQEYRNSITGLGWTLVRSGTLTKNELITLINNTKWNIGDIINYRSVTPTGANGSKANYSYVYGHTQIYTGGVLKTSGGSNWASSMGANYGCGFVYGSRNSDKWEYYIFKKV